MPLAFDSNLGRGIPFRGQLRSCDEVDSLVLSLTTCFFRNGYVDS